MPKVIFLNGPPRSGKDLAGQLLVNGTAGGLLPVCPGSARLMKFAHALKVSTHALFAGLQGRQVDTDACGYWTCPYGDGDAMAKLRMDSYYEAVKDEPVADFFGKTPREAYIAVSELLCKPIFGQDFWGHVLVRAMKASKYADYFAITDSGFAQEAAPIIEYAGRANCMLIRMHRKGCTFANDSRAYINLDVPSVFDLNNDGDVDHLHGLLHVAREF